MRNKLLKKLQFPIIFWASLLTFFFIIVYHFEGFDAATEIVFIFIMPGILPVHVHEFLFDKYFLKKRFWIYGILTIVTYCLFVFIIHLLELAVDPKGENSTIASIIIFTLVYMGAKYLIFGAKQQLKLNELQAKQSQAELELLKSQVNPHFLFNSLNIIYSLTLKKSEKSSEAVMLLSDLMRYILETSKKKFVPLQEEIDFIDNYLKLEELRLGKSINLNYTLHGDSKQLYIAPMMLIPFVENIFKHGVSSNQLNNSFEIIIDINKNDLHFTSSNNIVLKDNKLEQKENQTGIENVIRRLELIYPGQHNLNIEKISGKFQVNLQIKLNADAKI